MNHVALKMCRQATGASIRRAGLQRRAAGERLPHHEIESVELRGLNRGLGRAKDLRGRGGRAARRNFNAIVWGSDRSRQ